MPLDPQNRAQIRDRELRVWDLLLKGVEGTEIARREGVDPAVISRIKKRVERRITAETDGKAESLKARQIAEIRRARREAWRAWEESCKPAAKTTRRSGGTAAGTVEANEVKAQSGNPAFLDKVFDGIRLEARLTGTESKFATAFGMAPPIVKSVDDRPLTRNESRTWLSMTIPAAPAQRLTFFLRSPIFF